MLTVEKKISAIDYAKALVLPAYGEGFGMGSDKQVTGGSLSAKLYSPVSLKSWIIMKISTMVHKLERFLFCKLVSQLF